MFWLNRITLGRHSPVASRSSSHSPSVGQGGQVEEEVLGLDELRVSPLIFDGGPWSMRVSWLPQLSHWSPRAPSYPQIGQVPSM